MTRKGQPIKYIYHTRSVYCTVLLPSCEDAVFTACGKANAKSDPRFTRKFPLISAFNIKLSYSVVFRINHHEASFFFPLGKPTPQQASVLAVAYSGKINIEHQF